MEEDLEPSDIFVYISCIYKYLFICKREIDIYIDMYSATYIYICNMYTGEMYNI